MATAREKWRRSNRFTFRPDRKVALTLGKGVRVRLYTTREVAVVLRHSVQWVLTQINRKKMKASMYGNQYFITGQEIQRWMGYGRGMRDFGKLAKRRKGRSHDTTQSPQNQKAAVQAPVSKLQGDSEPRAGNSPPRRSGGYRQGSIWLLLRKVSHWPKPPNDGDC